MRLGVNSQTLLTPYITLHPLIGQWHTSPEYHLSILKTRLSQVACFMLKYFHFMAAAASHFVIVDKKICISCHMRTPGLS